MADAVHAFFASWSTLVVIWAVNAAIWGVVWSVSRRDRRLRDERFAADQRRWELRDQLWKMEDQLWHESMPDWQREAMEEANRKRAEVKREARRRLGLLEEEADG